MNGQWLYGGRNDMDNNYYASKIFLGMEWVK